MASRRPVAGEQLAQVDNPDPFAPPVWRSPVYQTPHAVIWMVQLARLMWRLAWFVLTHPVLDAVVAGLAFTWVKLGWPGLVALVLSVVAALALLRLLLPGWFAKLVSDPARNRWRWWFYRRRWQAAMTLAGLAPAYRSRVMLPVLGLRRESG